MATIARACDDAEPVDIPRPTRKIACMIDARRLRVLREVAEHGTVAAAADALHLTPSAVSQQLAALEREVGQPVVERNGRGVRLTGAAEVLVGHANVVLAQLEAAAADVAAYADGLVGTVRIAGFATGIAGDRRAGRGGAAREPPAARAGDRRAGGAGLLRRGDARRRRPGAVDEPRGSRRRPRTRATSGSRCASTRSTPCCPRRTRAPATTRSTSPRWRRSRSSARPTGRRATT